MSVLSRPPSVGDLVHFLPDVTICEVIGVLSEVRPFPIYALRHPQLGDIMVSHKAFIFPLGSIPETPAPKVFCSQCRWQHDVSLSALTSTDRDSASDMPWEDSDAARPTFPICREPDRVSRSPMDYVSGNRIPINCYEVNANGDCSTYQKTPMDQMDQTEDES